MSEEPARETKNCSACGEEILAVALKCKFCGVVLEKDSFDKLKQKANPQPGLFSRKVSGLGVMLAWFGVSGCFCMLTSQGGLDWIPLLVFALLLAAGIAKVTNDTRGDRKTSRMLSISLAGAIVLSVVAGVPAYVIIAGYNEALYRGGGNETAAIGALKTIGTAQALFREADKEADSNLDYGTLTELANAGTYGGLIDAVLGGGTKNGYIFETSYSSLTSEFLWFATARPAIPNVTGDRYFATNHEGVTFYTSSGAFRLNTVDCTIPANVAAVGR